MAPAAIIKQSRFVSRQTTVTMPADSRHPPSALFHFMEITFFWFSVSLQMQKCKMPAIKTATARSGLPLQCIKAFIKILQCKTWVGLPSCGFVFVDLNWRSLLRMRVYALLAYTNAWSHWSLIVAVISDISPRAVGFLIGAPLRSQQFPSQHLRRLFFCFCFLFSFFYLSLCYLLCVSENASVTIGDHTKRQFKHSNLNFSQRT